MAEDDDSTHPETDENEDEFQQAIEACEHAIDALRTGDPARAQALLAEARAAVEDGRAAEVGTQPQRETAWDCYD